MKKTLFIMIFAIIGCLSSYADGDWITAYEDSEFEISINSDIKEKYGEYRVWECWDFKTPQKLGKGKNARYYYSALYLKEYDGDLTRKRLISYIYYDKKGKVIDSASSEYGGDWTYIAPNTIGAAIAEAIEFLLSLDY